MYDVTNHGVTLNAGEPAMQPLSIANNGQIRALIAYYHFESRRLKYEALPQHMSPADFDTFRASLWDPDVVPTPWMKPLPSTQKELQEWQKIAKPNYTDYPTLTDSANMNRFIEQWESIAKAHRLEKTLDKATSHQNTKKICTSSNFSGCSLLSTSRSSIPQLVHSSRSTSTI